MVYVFARPVINAVSAVGKYARLLQTTAVANAPRSIGAVFIRTRAHAAILNRIAQLYESKRISATTAKQLFRSLQRYGPYSAPFDHIFQPDYGRTTPHPKPNPMPRLRRSRRPRFRKRFRKRMSRASRKLNFDTIRRNPRVMTKLSRDIEATATLVGGQKTYQITPMNLTQPFGGLHGTADYDYHDVTQLFFNRCLIHGFKLSLKAIIHASTTAQGVYVWTYPYDNTLESPPSITSYEAMVQHKNVRYTHIAVKNTEGDTIGYHSRYVSVKRYLDKSTLWTDPFSATSNPSQQQTLDNVTGPQHLVSLLLGFDNDKFNGTSSDSIELKVVLTVYMTLLDRQNGRVA